MWKNETVELQTNLMNIPAELHGFNYTTLIVRCIYSMYDIQRFENSIILH